MAEQKQDDQLEHTYSSYVRIQDVALETYLGRGTIGRSGERGSGISVLVARHDNNDDIYIYIYIYICHQQTDCFVVSQLIIVCRHVWRLKLGSKAGQLYVRLSIIPFTQQENHFSSRIIRYYIVVYVCLHFFFTGYQCVQFIHRALHFASGRKIRGKMDKSYSYKDFSNDISFFIKEFRQGKYFLNFSIFIQLRK